MGPRRSQAIAGGRSVSAGSIDERILHAAREVLISNPHAPVSDVADAAGVGVASLYRRFANREELARRLALDLMLRLTDEANARAARLPADPWAEFVEFFVASMDAGAGTMEALAGTFDPGERLNQVGRELYDAISGMLAVAQGLEAVRRDIDALDVLQIFHMLRCVQFGDPDRDRRLRRRYIELLLPSLRTERAAALSQPAPTWDEQLGNWNRWARSGTA